MRQQEIINTVLGEMTIHSPEINRRVSDFRPVVTTFEQNAVIKPFDYNIISQYQLRLTLGVNFSASGGNEYKQAREHAERLLVRHITAALRPLAIQALRVAYDGNRGETIATLQELCAKLEGSAR